MSEFNKYPSTNQFRDIVKHIRKMSDYRGLPYPTLTFEGTVKIHGTNAAIVVSKGEFITQSRTRVITPESDNFGFSAWANFYKEDILKILDDSCSNTKYTCFEEVLDQEVQSISLYGEWFGRGIQGGVAVDDVDRKFCLFAIKIISLIGETVWFHSKNDLSVFNNKDIGFYSVDDFKSYTVEIDFNRPELATQTMIDITNSVELECPVGKYFGIEGVGEGVVWNSEYLGERIFFKVKGEKHSSSKVKKLASVDVEKLNSVREMVDYCITDNRLNQAISELFTTRNMEPSILNTGDFIRWVIGDVWKEELDTITQAGITDKQFNSPASKKCRDWFVSYLDKGVIK